MTKSAKPMVRNGTGGMKMAATAATQTPNTGLNSNNNAMLFLKKTAAVQQNLPSQPQQHFTNPPPHPATQQSVSPPFCLPIILMQNNHHGGALVYVQYTTAAAARYSLSTFNSLNPLVYRAPVECAEIVGAMRRNREMNVIPDDELDLIDRFRLELEVHLTEYFKNRVHLTIYGSTINGFGTQRCDVDMSLTFGSPVTESSDEIMREVAKALVDFPNGVDERYISAKVPIVRFKCRHMDIEADISYNNTLALYNTQLLREYTRWDPIRLPILGVWIKTWAKKCGVGDASKGSLSSYAWMIMMIHYLQQLKPLGLLPFLQQYPRHKYEDRYVNGWNVYFWKNVDPNRSKLIVHSVYDLFIGFLHYYLYCFDFRHHIVQMGCEKIVNKPCSWDKHPICVEDPFEKDHNLGQSVDHQMFDYIMRCMHRTLGAFTSPKLRQDFFVSIGLSPNPPEGFKMDGEIQKQYLEYLLYSCKLREEPPVRIFGHRQRTASLSTNSSF